MTRAAWWLACLLGIAAVGWLDYATGMEISVAFLYLLPIALAAWMLGMRAAAGTAILGAAMWLFDDWKRAPDYSHPAIPYWNAGIELGFFMTTAVLLSRLKRALEEEKRLARTDPLTGALNGRAFDAVAQDELVRARRTGQPITLAYLDIDGFKEVNDRWGHQTGDRVLRAVAETLRGSLRATDAFARLGGDEFAVLLPETAFTEAGRPLEKIRNDLLAAMRAQGWPPTFSIGAVTFGMPPASVDEMIRVADAAMYKIKNSGKDRLVLEAYA